MQASYNPDLSLEEYDDYMALSKPAGLVTSLKYDGIEVLEQNSKESNRGYWDLNWGSDYYRFSGTWCHVITNTQSKIEISFVKTYDTSSSSSLPLNIDIRYVLLRGSSGFYSYGIYQKKSGWPSFSFSQTRLVFKLTEDKFNFMAVGDSKQRVMPYPEDRRDSEQLAYPEAVILTNPKNASLKGEVDDKYQYSCDNRDNHVHGWVSFDPLVGFWIIMPSDEFRNGGPMKQNLQSHCGPTALAMFHSLHYGGMPLETYFSRNENWKKVFGPVFMYLNKATSSSSTSSSLWYDAKRQMRAEAASWPYSWPASSAYVTASGRASVSGTLLVQDSHVSKTPYRASYAMIGLALRGARSWQQESKGYQFWTEADSYGGFHISNILPGTYDLYGWVPGVIGSYKKDSSIVITGGSSLELHSIIFKPPRDGPTLWEIGYPDRTANGFFVPDANPKYVNKLFVTQEKFRQYGMWERYTELYPENDLVYEVGSSKSEKDWFFIHGTRVQKDGSLKYTTWEIKFTLQDVLYGAYTLRIAIAAANSARLLVVVNSSGTMYNSLLFGNDNAIARHGIHGLYHLFEVQIKHEFLRKGSNSIYLTQNSTSSLFSGLMYDYLRLEGPSNTSDMAVQQ